MSKAVLNKDMIIAFNSKGTVDIKVPKGVGLDRIRVVNGQVIDLLDLDEIWVERRSGKWILHAAQYPGCQLVEMTYPDRKKLVNDNGTYRLKTAQEISDEEDEKAADVAENNTLYVSLANMVDNLKFGQIDNHIENVFGGLSTAQKASLKVLYKAVLYLGKNR